MLVLRSSCSTIVLPPPPPPRGNRPRRLKDGLSEKLQALNTKHKGLPGLLKAYNERKGKRASPVLVVHIDGPEDIRICGISGDKPPVISIRGLLQAERMCMQALRLPTRHEAARYISSALPSLESAVPGIDNKGLLTTHALVSWLRDFPQRQLVTEKSKTILALDEDRRSGDELIRQLGFASRELDSKTFVLTCGEADAAVAVYLKDNEVFENKNTRFDSASPVSYAISKADAKGLPWVIMTRGGCVRLYSARNEGVGRRGRAESYIECQTSLLGDNNEGLLWLLFSADALKIDGTIYGALEESRQFTDDAASKLRERIYDIAVPKLALGVCDGMGMKNPTRQDFALAYEMALTVLFRLLFIAYAEDRDLLPYKSNNLYRARSLTQKAIELSGLLSADKKPGDGDNLWSEIKQLFKAVSEGRDDWDVPAYNGALFSSERKRSKVGYLLSGLEISNSFFAEALEALLLVKAGDTLGPVDFRSMSVREFGTIYEGLLESGLELAKRDLCRNNSGDYRPAIGTEIPEIRKGAIYLHNRSSSRKSSGSYYTPAALVEDLLKSTLEPAIKKHLKRLDELDDPAEQAEQFFKFRVADIAMGSGHFLVMAIDTIEREFSEWLRRNNNPGIIRELEILREAARKHLGDLADSISIEDGQLLRRMIARRCIYGIDLNPLAVQLTRLSVWIHTFVPGLPLSFLDRNLKQGNSLIGVAYLNEIEKAIEKATKDESLFEIDVEKLLGKARKPLDKILRSADLNVGEIRQDMKYQDEIKKATRETTAVCDIIIAQPVLENMAKNKLKQAKAAYERAEKNSINPQNSTEARNLKAAQRKLKSAQDLLVNFNLRQWSDGEFSLLGSEEHKLAKSLLQLTYSTHFPVAFPEVFLDNKRGFDVILGNPPWEKAKVEEHKFWARYFPGQTGYPDDGRDPMLNPQGFKRADLARMLEAEVKYNDKLRLFLRSGNFPGIGEGDPDLYEAFSWRFWHLVDSRQGRIGVVMPRGLLSGKGSTQIRKRIFSESSLVSATTLVNSRHWIFPIHASYTVCLLSISLLTHEPKKGLWLRGPFDKDDFEKYVGKPGENFSFKEVFQWSKDASLPLLPKPMSVSVFAQLNKSPRFGDNNSSVFHVRACHELHTTEDKDLFNRQDIKRCPKHRWKIYGGRSFNLWNPDTGEYYASGDPSEILPELFDRRLNSYGHSNGVYRGFSKKYIEDTSTLEAHRPRIAFRDGTGRINNRTVLAALLPPETFLVHTGNVLVFPRGDIQDQAYVLGVMSSVPFDWYARRVVETHLTLSILNSIPLPRPKRISPLWKRVAKLAGRLACPDERYAEWAKDVGVEYGPVDPEQKLEMVVELDAVVAHLYSLSEKQLWHIFETFHEKKSRRSKNADPINKVDDERRDKVLEHYRQWAKKLGEATGDSNKQAKKKARGKAGE